jgi:ribosomal-protein-alanine N-acetyltransferase
MSSRAPFVPLATPRLALVALTLADAPAIFSYSSDPQISQLVAWPRHRQISDSRSFVARSMVGYAQGGHYEWALKRRTDEAFVGTCGFSRIDTTSGVAEINYVLAKPYWGRGYATEAAAAVIEFGFQKLGLRSIEAAAFPENSASLRVMAKLGMRYREAGSLGGDSSALLPVSIWQVEREHWSGGSPKSGNY